MRIALDPQMLRLSTSLLDLPDAAASMGFRWLELSPRRDFVPFHRHPRADMETVRRLKGRLADAGVGISSLLAVMRWAGPGEDERQAAVRYFKRVVEYCVELGVDTVGSEFNGRPDQSHACEAMFWRSMDDLLPVFEREGVKLALEPHPDDFVEEGFAAVDLVRAIDRPWVSFVYCLPHTFHQGGDASGVVRYAGDRLTHVHVADAMDHRASTGLRYVLNPDDAPTRVHQHMEVGRGDVDFDAAFAAFAEVGFDGVLTSCVFGWDESARDATANNLAATRDLVARHFPDAEVS